jgi:putative FmdB family regulatory protein
MPTYEYVCKSCGDRLEVQQRFTDDPLTECPTCEGPLRKVFGNVGIAFKGSGFYKTDSRSGSGSKSSGSSSSNGESKTSESTSTPSKTADAASSGSGSSGSSSSASTAANSSS